MPVSIDDLCRSFGVSPATVERWGRQGKIPASRKDGQLWFRRKDIEKWAASQNIRLAQPGRRGDAAADNQPTLAQAFENGGVYRNIQGTDKASVIQGCIEGMDIIPGDFKRDLLDRIMEREAAMSTGMGNGIAVPHPREPVVYLPCSAIVSCIPAEPVDFGALDGRPVGILFFLLSTSLSHHLPLLSALSGCLKRVQPPADPETLLKNIKELAGCSG